MCPRVPSLNCQYPSLTMFQVDLIIPEEVCDTVQQKLLGADKPAPVYKQVVMKLGEILSGDFFTEYIKQRKTNFGRLSMPTLSSLTLSIGDTTMLSDGRVHIDNVVTLKDGPWPLDQNAA